jgi:hypothetical protein
MRQPGHLSALTPTLRSSDQRGLVASSDHLTNLRQQSLRGGRFAEIDGLAKHALFIQFRRAIPAGQHIWNAHGPEHLRNWRDPLTSKVHIQYGRFGLLAS